MTQTITEGTQTIKALVAGLLVAAAMMAACLMLVDRPAHAADTFTVERTVDTPDVNVGDGDCDVTLAATGFQCTLRAAIQEANATPEADLIRFAILDGGTGVQTIEVGKAGFGALPDITHPVTIDGYTQPGASPNTLAVGDNAVLKIELNGSNVQGAEGLDLENNSRASVVKGLVINRFGSSGIFVSTSATVIEGNFIGTDPSGTQDLGNGSHGIEIRKAFSTTEPEDSNIGGNSPAARNVISGNGGDGVNIFANSTAGHHFLQNNYIGTDKNGSGALGNSGNGVSISGSTRNVVGNNPEFKNTVAFNGGDGVSINTAFQGPATGNFVHANSIFANGGLGIDLVGTDGPTANDAGDADTGPNGLQNKPVLTSAKNTSVTTVSGKLNGRPNTSYIIEFFSNPSGGDEGKVFIGQKEVATDASGNASFAFKPASKVAAGRTVTAAAWDAGLNTSEFSAPKTVTLSSGSVLAPDTLKVRGPSGLTKSPTAHFKFFSPDPEATFECSLDGGAYYGCSSPENVNRLSEGRHSFVVRAIDGEGADQSPALWAWTVDRDNR
jgi:hypothetical protein